MPEALWESGKMLCLVSFLAGSACVDEDVLQKDLIV